MHHQRSETWSTVLTIGHSTRSLTDFIALLQTHSVTHLADVRAFAGSRRHPQFNRDTLPQALRAVNVGYSHMPGLGGRRRPWPNSPNMGWQNESFRGYADYMHTPEFAAQLQSLIALAERERIVLMCAEAVPWRCHRSLIADALVIRNIPVEHILSPTRRQTHKLTAWAHVEDTILTYPETHDDQHSGR